MGRWGFIQSKTDYQQLLAECDLVLSTALHDFQGLSVLEAVQAGCIPLLPDHLVYPEIFSSAYLYRCDGEPKAIAKEVFERLSLWLQRDNGRHYPISDILTGPKCVSSIFMHIKSY